MAWTTQWQRVGRGGQVKGSGIQLTGLAGGLDKGMLERGATPRLAVSLLMPLLQKLEDKRS